MIMNPVFLSFGEKNNLSDLDYSISPSVKMKPIHYNNDYSYDMLLWSTHLLSPTLKYNRTHPFKR